VLFPTGPAYALSINEKLDAKPTEGVHASKIIQKKIEKIVLHFIFSASFQQYLKCDYAQPMPQVITATYYKRMTLSRFLDYELRTLFVVDLRN